MKMTIFNSDFLNTTFADDLSFFLNNLLKVKNLVDTFKAFFSGLKANFSKCGISELSSLKWVIEI